MEEQEACGVQQLKVSQRRFSGHKELGSVPSDSPRTSGASVDTVQAAGLEGRRRSAGSRPGRKASLSQRVQDLRNVIALQEKGRKIFMLSCEEKLNQNRELLPSLRKAVQEDIYALELVEKDSKLTVAEACRTEKPLGIALARETVEVAQEKLLGKIYKRVNKCNLLLYQLRQRSRAWDELQRRLQQLQDVQAGDKRHQAQVIRQLENSIEKILMKIRTAQKVTPLYLAVRKVLKKELAQLPQHLDLLYEMAQQYQRELGDMELMASSALKAAEATKKEMIKMKTQFHAERERQCRSLAAQNVPINRLWLKEAMEKQLRAQARYRLTTHLTNLHMDDSVEDIKLKDTKSRMEHEAWVTEKMEKAKATVQCSCVWDIPSRLLAQQKSSVKLEQYVNKCKEKQQALKEKLMELELKQAELKFRQAPNKTRVLEEELRRNLQLEEARLQRMRAQMLRSQELLAEFENGIDNILVRLHGITVPNQDDSVKASGVEEKLQRCEQKLRCLVQRVANLPPESYSPDENNETFVKVRNFLERTTAKDAQNLRISLDDIGSSTPEPFDFADKDDSLVLTREDIKKQGLHLIERKKKGIRK